MSWVLNRPAHVAYASDQTDAINEAAQPPANQLYIMFVKDVVPQDYVIKYLRATLPGTIIIPGFPELINCDEMYNQLTPSTTLPWTASPEYIVQAVAHSNGLTSGRARGPLHAYLNPQKPVVIVHIKPVDIPQGLDFVSGIVPLAMIDENAARYGAKISNRALDALKHLKHFPGLTILLTQGWDAAARHERSMYNTGECMTLFSGLPYNIFMTVDRAMFE